MKYRVRCSACNLEKDIFADNAPKFCFECGKPLSEVTVISTKMRKTAEDRMRAMDEMLPRLTEACTEYRRLLKEWQKHYYCVASYHHRSIVTDEEFERFQDAPYIKKEGR